MQLIGMEKNMQKKLISDLLQAKDSIKNFYLGHPVEGGKDISMSFSLLL